MNCKNCDYLVERYGFCTKAMMHVTKPTDHLSFNPPRTHRKSDDKYFNKLNKSCDALDSK